MVATSLPSATVTLEQPKHVQGAWWLDAKLSGHVVSVEWRPKRGFGVSAGLDTAYGEGPHEVHQDPVATAKRVIELLQRRETTRTPEETSLRQLRASRRVSQDMLASRLKIRQAAVSKLERRADLNLSTLRRVIAALGGDLELRVQFPGERVKVLRFGDLRAEAVAGRGGDETNLVAIDPDTHQRLMRNERLRVLGQLSAGIAHDFNDLLAAILGNVQLIQAKNSDSSLSEKLRSIELAAVTAGETVKRLREFVKPSGRAELEVVDLAEVAKDALAVIQPRWKDQAQSMGISYEVSVEAIEPAPVRADRAEMREVIINIALNALDAMPRGGRLTISVGVRGDESYCSIQDTGEGMSEETRRQVFEPFFTTKGETGTGLGLAVVASIVERHLGKVEVETKLRNGSVFRVLLPTAARQIEAPKIEPVQPEQRERGGKILVVDDEPGVRGLVADILRTRGYTVSEQSDSASALRAFRHEKFDVVLTDLVMPGMSGWELVERLRDLDADVPVALVTGWGVEAGEARAKGIDFVLSKPFLVDSIEKVAAAGIAKRNTVGNK